MNWEIDAWVLAGAIRVSFENLNIMEPGSEKNVGKEKDFQGVVFMMFWKKSLKSMRDFVETSYLLSFKKILVN